MAKKTPRPGTVPMEALAIDFGSLKTLTLVYEKRSFTEAALALNVSQSVVSYTIEKLRRSFGDPLFFRQGGRIQPTERCEVVAAAAREMLERVEQLSAPATFDPATADATVRIACNYYERLLIIPLVVAALRREAPGLRLEVVNSRTEGDQQLAQGEADLMIGPQLPNMSGFYCRSLLQDHYVCVMDCENPLANRPLSLECYTACNHVTITYGNRWRSKYLLELDALGLALNHVIKTHSPSGVDAIVSETDLVATVPSRIAATFEDRVRTVESPCPSPFDINLVWTTRTHGAPMHMWFRDLIAECARLASKEKRASA